MAGSMIGNALFSGGGSAADAATPQVEAAPPAAPQLAGAACTFETRQFLQCMSNTQDDLNDCAAFYDAFKQCNLHAQLGQ